MKKEYCVKMWVRVEAESEIDAEYTINRYVYKLNEKKGIIDYKFEDVIPWEEYEKKSLPRRINR